MKTNASVLTLRVPLELKHRIEQVADEQGVSINQFALHSLIKEIKDMETYNFFAARWHNKSKKVVLDKFHDVLRKIKSKKSPVWDTI
jgi:hypothetical protein